ncbi:MAG: aspartate 1-decarboxylase [Candidatus Omnitrophota bacterium]|nr:MAG: aspartate 1-decarboxylase [Candidatus Omnitrophota bacterium]
MLITLCKSKIQGAVVVEKVLYYEGSITIAQELLEAADILPNERVQVVNFNNGKRFETYVILGRRSSGICLNGPASRLGEVGDRLIIISYGLLEKEEAKRFKPRIVYVNEKNEIERIEG